MSLSKPNGLYLDLEAEELFVGDAEKQKIIKCKVKSKWETYINNNQNNTFQNDFTVVMYGESSRSGTKKHQPSTIKDFTIIIATLT